MVNMVETRVGKVACGDAEKGPRWCCFMPRCMTAGISTRSCQAFVATTA